MERMLEGMVIFVAKIHNYILSLNDAYEKNFTDKQLHFLVIGILGMLILMVIYPFNNISCMVITVTETKIIRFAKQ